MSEQQFEAPESEGVTRAAQLAAMSVTVLEAIARLRAQRATEHAARDEHATAAARAERTADHAAARVAWSPSHQDEWLRTASTADLGRAWAAASPWASTDPDAHEATRRVERRLHELHPDAMATYHQARAAGADPAEAMREAAPLFARPLAITTATAEAQANLHTDRGTRKPRDVAADGYPYPTSDAVATASRRSDRPSHVITALPHCTPTSRQSTSR